MALDLKILVRTCMVLVGILIPRPGSNPFDREIQVIGRRQQPRGQLASVAFGGGQVTAHQSHGVTSRDS